MLFKKANATRCEDDPGLDEAVEEDAPETSHPVAVNTFDKLTRLHGQIQHQLAAQDALLQKLLREDGALAGDVL